MILLAVFAPSGRPLILWAGTGTQRLELPATALSQNATYTGTIIATDVDKTLPEEERAAIITQHMNMVNVISEGWRQREKEGA